MIARLEEIKRILLHEWDPIGVRDAAGAVDEYDRYAFRIFATGQPSADDIAFYLDWLQSEHMGLPLTAGHNRAIAVRIAGLRDA
jgi:hypothetical protein